MKPLSVMKMVGIFTAIIVVGTGFLYARSTKNSPVVTSSQTAQATEKKCPSLTIDEQIAQADLIITGEVFVVLPDEPDAEVYIKPITTYKGTSPVPLIIQAKAAQSSTTKQAVLAQFVVLPDGSMERELHFASDQPPYLLFLRQTGNRFLTSRCDGSRSLGAGVTAEEQAALSS